MIRKGSVAAATQLRRRGMYDRGLWRLQSRHRRGGEQPLHRFGRQARAPPDYQSQARSAATQ